jgi:hypothetical protein
MRKRIAQEEISRSEGVDDSTELQIKIDTMKEKVETISRGRHFEMSAEQIHDSFPEKQSRQRDVLMFLYRNPLIFALVLEFLRGCDVLARFEDKSQLLSLYDEANFFEITELVDQIEMELHLKIPRAEGNPPSPLRRISHPPESASHLEP